MIDVRTAIGFELDVYGGDADITRRQGESDSDYRVRIFNLEHPALTVRDQFATAALQGLLANDISWIGQPENAAWTAYQMADAMLAERAK